MSEWTREFFSEEVMRGPKPSFLIWSEVVGSALLSLACLAIAATVVHVVLRRGSAPFRRVAGVLTAFVVGSSALYFLEVVAFFRPVAEVDAVVRIVTALLAVAAALALPSLLPQGAALARSAETARARGAELEKMIGQLAVMYESVRAADVTKSRFIANVSHELRTPLTLVLAPAERMLDDPNLTLEQRRDLSVIIRSARTLLKHVNDLLDIARVEAGHLELSYCSTDVARLVRRAAAHFDAIAAERSTSLTVDCPSELMAELDPDRFERVLLNLLSNAFKVTPRNGTIRCSLRVEGDSRLLLEVADSGPGVPESERKRIFERFAQVDDSPTRRLGGTGLGLSIVREFVEAHRGSVSVGTAPEGGACFSVALPLDAPPKSEIRKSLPAPSEETRAALDEALDELSLCEGAVGSTISAGRSRVLVVEDNAEMNRFIREVLGSDFTVVGVLDAQAAEQAIAEECPDLVVTDVMMPGTSGDELVRNLRRQPAFVDLPVLVLTAKPDENLRVSLLGEGTIDYLVKPFSAPELLVRAKNLIALRRAREVLQTELDTQVRDLDVLASELAQQKRDMAGALEAARASRDEAERASRVKSTFLRMVSHELRTPLAAIQLQLDRLCRSADQIPEKQRDLLLRCAGSTRKLARLVESILEYTRIEGGRLEVSKRSFDPGEMATEVVALTQPHAEQKALGLNLHVAPFLPHVETDPRLLRLVLLNLVENAVKFTERGSVDVEVGMVGGELTLRVRDSGPGIPEEQHPLVFEPFEQLAPNENKHLPGIGLGLALVREMVSALGGRVELSSRVGEGACFTVTVPVSCVKAA